jgi:membrane protein DedA with SNARE-associated domain
MDLLANLGYGLLFVLIAGESAGVPLPGESALIAAAILASTGHLWLPAVIAVAAAAAIVGDNLGYWLGRRGGRWLWTRGGRWQAARADALERGERFFARHGAKAVFFGRWVPWLRIFAAWIAGTAGMGWRRFLVWNALGGLAWASSVGLLADLAGRGGAAVIAGVGTGLSVASAVAIALLLLRARRSRGPRARTASVPSIAGIKRR